MSKKSTVKMSFQVATSEQEAAPQQQQKQQTVQVAAPAQQSQSQRREVQTGGIQFEEKQYSSGKFGHIKDNLDAQKRYDAAFASMSLRAGRAGDQFDIERKLEKRYDDDEKLGTPRRTLEWICRVLQGQIQQPNGTDWKQIQLYLKDGTILCKLMNRLLKHANMDPVGYRAKANPTFVGINNLDSFLNGAKRYGVPTESLFQPSDLHEGRKGQLPCVFQCLNALGCVANARGFQPPYEESAPPKADWCKEECYD